jgi:hypothetical protein
VVYNPLMRILNYVFLKLAFLTRIIYLINKKLKNAVFWDVMPCPFCKKYYYFFAVCFGC